MNKITGIRALLYDTYSKCFAFLHPDKKSREYQKVETAQSKINENEEDVEDRGEWSTQETIYQTQFNGETNERKKKPVLIGNIEEDAGVHKDDVKKKLFL